MSAVAFAPGFSAQFRSDTGGSLFLVQSSTSGPHRMTTTQGLPSFYAKLSITRCINIFRIVFVASTALVGIQPRPANAQIETQTRPPVPTQTKSISYLTGIPYVSGGGPLQQLDLYVPTDRQGEPLIVVVHGGGWVNGSKTGDSLNPVPLDLLWDGYAIASINYRLAPDAAWPAQMQDCKAAIRWLRAHAHDYGYDPNRVGAYGESSGGHLAAVLGTSSATTTFDVGENLGYSSSVTCAVDMFGPTDLIALADTPLGQGVLPLLFGGPVQDHLDLARSANPITYVQRSEPPMLVVHGTDDALVPYSQSVLLAEAMKKANARYHFHTVIGGGHNGYFGYLGQGIGLFEDQAVKPMIHAFFAHYLQNWKRTDGFAFTP
jgi:acetyl esterase/lipase